MLQQFDTLVWHQDFVEKSAIHDVYFSMNYWSHNAALHNIAVISYNETVLLVEKTTHQLTVDKLIQTCKV